MLTEVLILLCTLLLLVYAVTWVRSSHGYPPGPRRWPLIGSLLSIQDSKTLLHMTLTKMTKTYGDIFTLYLPSQPTIVINTAKVAREALVTQKDNFSGRPYLFLTNYISRGGKGLGFNDFSKPMVFARKIAHSTLRLYEPNLEDKIKEEGIAIAKRFHNYKNKPFDPTMDFSLAITNIIFSVVYGERFDLDDKELHETIRYSYLHATLLAPLNILNVFPWLIYFPIPQTRLLNEMIENRSQVKDARYYKMKETFKENQIRNLVDALLQAKLEEERDDTNSNSPKYMTDDHVMAITDSMFGAGSETTATTLRWELVYLLNYPEIQERIYTEIQDVFGSDGRIELKGRRECHFLEAFLTEILRSTSIVSLFPHKSTCDTVLCGYRIPKDTTVLLNLWAINHDDTEWHNPYEFKPSRFLDSKGEFTGTAQNMGFMPFGAGRRTCIGEAMAKKELFLISAMLFQTFKFENPKGSSPPDLNDGTLGITFGPKPFKVVAKARNGCTN